MIEAETHSLLQDEMPAEVRALKEHVRRCKQKLGTTSLRDTIAEAVRRYIVVALAMGIAYATIGAIVNLDDTDFNRCGTVVCPLI